MDTTNDEVMLSVIIPVYNVEKYINQCLDSVLDQSFGNIEVILVDDGSTDQSGRICDEYKTRDARVSVIHQENKGLSDARNVGVQQASGKWISFVDSDDWIDIDMYDTLFRALKLCDEADIVLCSHCDVFDQNMVTQKGNGATYLFSQGELLSEYTNTHSRYNISPSVWDRIYRRELISDISFPSGRLNEDILYTVEVFCRVKAAIYVDQELYYYRCCRDGSISASAYSEKRIIDNIFLRTAAENKLRSSGYTKEADMVFLDCYQTIFDLSLLDSDVETIRKDYCRKNVWKLVNLICTPFRIPFRKKTGVILFIFFNKGYRWLIKMRDRIKK